MYAVAGHPINALRATSALALVAVIVCLDLGCQRQSSAQVVAHNPTASGPETKLSEPLLPAVSATEVVASLNLNVSDSLGPRFAGTAARKAFDDGQWAGCARGFGQAGQQAPWQARAMQLLCIQRSGGALVMVARGFEALARSGGLLAEHAWLWAAQAWLQAAKPAAALGAIDKITLSRFGRAQRAQIVRAQALGKRAQVAEAAQAWRAVLALDKPMAPVHLFAAAEALASAGQTKSALGALHKLLGTLPSRDLETRANAVLSRLQAPTQGLPVQVVMKRALVAKGRQKRQLAMKLADEVMKRSGVGTPLWCEAGMVKAKVMEIFWKRRKEASALYLHLVDNCPDSAVSAKLWYRAGKRNALSADKNKALAVFERIVRKAPKTTLLDDALRLQARIHEQAGRAKRADSLRMQAIEVRGDMSNYVAWDLMWARIKSRKWRAVVRTAQRVRQIAAPATYEYNQSRIAYWHGYALNKLGKRRQATKIWSKVVSQSPWSWYGMLAHTRLRQRSPKQAAAALAQWHKRAALTESIGAVFKRIARDRHLLAAIELSRMGLVTSAKAELTLVQWSRAGADAPLMRAALHDAVGEVTRSVAWAIKAPHVGFAAPKGDHKRRWRLSYPRPEGFVSKVEEAAKKFGVDPAFVWAIMRSESRFNPRIQSPVHATGLLQLMLATAKAQNRRLGAPFSVSYAALKRPEVNIPLGVAFMARLTEVSGDHWAMVASAYNAGPGNNRKWRRQWPKSELDLFVESIPFKENRRYVKAVLTSWCRYRGLYYDKAMSELALNLPARR